MTFDFRPSRQSLGTYHNIIDDEHGWRDHFYTISERQASTCRQALWTCAAGACIAVGYLCYFATKKGVPRPVMFAFGCAAGATGMVWGLGYFGEYAGAPLRKKALLLLALALYPSSITLIALSMA